MVSRSCILLAMCALFAAAWSGDQKHQDRAIAQRQGRTAASVRVATRTDLPAGEASHFRTTTTATATTGSAIVPLPDLPAGAYRIVGSDGTVRSITVNGTAQSGAAPIVQFEQQGIRWYFIRLDGGPIHQAAGPGEPLR